MKFQARREASASKSSLSFSFDGVVAPPCPVTFYFETIALEPFRIYYIIMEI